MSTTTHRPHDAQPTAYRPHDAQPMTARPHEAQAAAHRPHEAQAATARPHDAQPTTYRPHDAQPFQTVAPGVEFCFLRRHGDAPAGSPGLTLMVRMAKGAHARHHGHPGGEEVYLVSGRLRVGSRLLSPGDYLWTAPGEAHDGFAEEETVFFAVLPGGLDLAAGA
ncbi:MAG TPA: cupin domain-containing protein [Polyangiaceae bacterium]|nr:cupin domain-containing protein [Polyangiaceae bacterium]